MKKESKIAGAALVLVVAILIGLYVWELINSRQTEGPSPARFAYSTVAYGAVPTDGAVVMTRAVDLRWWAGALARSNTVYLHSDLDLVTSGDPRALCAETKETTVKVSDLKPDTSYYWRVDTVNPQEPNSPWAGPIWHFRIPPRQATNRYPPQGATHVQTDVQLTWDPGVDAVAHRIAFGSDPNALTTGPGETIDVPVTSFNPGDLLPGTTYYWRVDVVSEAAVAPGDLMNFTVMTDTHITPASDPNLIGWWKADEPATALGLLDHSGHGLHAALEGHATWIEGVKDGAVDMDGRSTFKTCKAPNTEVSQATLCAWIRPKGMCADTAGIVFWRGSQTSGLNLTEGNQLGYHWNDHPTSYNYRSGLIVPQEQWSFVAIVIEPNEARFYVNDLKAPATNSAPHAASAFDGPMHLGRDPYDLKRSFAGALDDMRFYDRALSPDELAEIRDYGGDSE